MELDLTTLGFGGTLVLLSISLLAVMFRVYRLLTDLSAKVEAITAKVEINTAKIEALDARVETLAAEVAENREQIRLLRAEFRLFRAEMSEEFRQVRAEASEEFRLVRAESREDSGVFRTENRDSLSEMGRRIGRLRDRVDANAVKHDANIIDVGKQVAAFNERVSRVEGYVDGITGGEWPVASGH
jgi:chromosome segregation ATPase